MNFHQFKLIFKSAFVTYKYGYKLKHESDHTVKKALRAQYAQDIMDMLHLNIEVVNKEKLPQEGQFLVACNHISVIDPLIVEIVNKDSSIYGHWIAKKELYNSPFFGYFTRNAGTILLDRESDDKGSFFTDIKKVVKEEELSIYIFPEGTRNKTEKVLQEFKGGAQIIALKNRLPILPIFIERDARAKVRKAIRGEAKEQTIVATVGDIIDYKDRSKPLEERYREQFGLASDE